MSPEYLAEISRRWSGPQLTDARRNWSLFEEHRAELEELVHAYLLDNWQKDLSGKCHNPDGTLAGMCWNAATGAQPCRLYLDFEEHFQKFFIRRGLIAYLKLLIHARAKAHAAEPTLPLPFAAPAAVTPAP